MLSPRMAAFDAFPLDGTRQSGAKLSIARCKSQAVSSRIWDKKRKEHVSGLKGTGSTICVAHSCLNQV